MDYGNVLERAWRITWRFKGLWVLGILSGCSSGSGGGGGGGSNYSSSLDNGAAPEQFSQLEHFIENIDPAIIIAVVVALVLFVMLLSAIFLLVRVFGQAGLIHGVSRADDGDEVTLASAATGGLEFFWRLLGLELLLLGIGLVLGLAIGVAVLLFLLFTLGLGALILLPLMCIAIPLGILFGLALQIYLQLVRTGIVVDSLSITEGLKEAWTLARQQTTELIVMGLILVLGGSIVGLILSVPFFLLAIPVAGGLLLGTETALGIGVGVAILCCLIYLPILLLLSGILQTFIQSAWTVTYRRLTGRSGAELAPASA